MDIFKSLIKRYIEFKSWKTNEYLLVIESDDWGTERTRDKDALEKLLKINKQVSDDRMTILDTIASTDDLSLLFETLESVRDSVGNPAIITANVCTANPDFDSIKNSGFSEFKYEPFFKTIERKDKGRERLQLWHEGKEKKLFFPQLHGREHVHALGWLAELRFGNSELLKAFDVGAWGIPYSPLGIKRRRNLLAALDVYDITGEKEFQENWLSESMEIFSSYFNYKPLTFIPPAYTWHSRIGTHLEHLGLQGVQGISFQYQPKKNGSKSLYKKVMHINGQKIDSTHKLIKLSRNAFFEPFSNPSFDWTGNALRAINRSFSLGMPAILGAHRVNFIGQYSAKNRDNNLKDLQKLLSTVVQKWPKVKFITSVDLMDRMLKKRI